MFVALVLTVCMLSDPGQCQDQELIFESHGSLAQCMFEAPPYIAEWATTHPQWKVTRWKCADPGALGSRT
jgi:hypothetical protein